MNSATSRTPRLAASLGLYLAALLAFSLLAPLAIAHAAQVVASVGATEHAKPKTKVGFGIVPATAKDIDVRSLFSFGLVPGSTAYDHVAVVNYSPKRLDLDVYATDALNPAKGGYALRAASERPVDLGAWVVVGSPSRHRIVSVPGRRKNGSPGRVILPVSISVPVNATPGDHAAGIVASLNTLGKNPKGQNIRLEQRVAARVYVRVDGQLRPGLAVTALTAHFVQGSRPWEHGSVRVVYTVSNIGNLRLGFNPSLTVQGPWGLGVRTVKDAPVAELLPGNSQTFRTLVPEVWPLGYLHVTANVTPKAAVAAEPPRLGVVRETIRITAVTWALLLVFALLLALLAYLVFRQIRRRRNSEGRSVSVVEIPKQATRPVSNASR